MCFFNSPAATQRGRLIVFNRRNKCANPVNRFLVEQKRRMALTLDDKDLRALVPAGHFPKRSNRKKIGIRASKWCDAGAQMLGTLLRCGTTLVPTMQPSAAAKLDQLDALRPELEKHIKSMLDASQVEGKRQ